MHARSVMIKPASGLCNMRCRYCFYQDEVKRRGDKNAKIMTLETLHTVLKKILAETSGYCVIAFQGGEPTLAGLDFFRKEIAMEQELNINHCQIDHCIQTNGYCINEEWATFFADNHFLVGLSLDGPQEIHDHYRIDANDKGTYQKVLHAAQLLQDNKVDFNILSVVTADLARNFQDVYQFFSSKEFSYQQYVPCLDPFESERGKQDWSLTPELMELYLKTAFDCWYQDRKCGHFVYHRYFDNLLAILVGQQPEACDMQGICSPQLVVESDGTAYPCDFYCLDEWRLGNFMSDSLETIEQNRLPFLQQGSYIHPECKECPWGVLCRGGCRRDRCQNPLSSPGKNYFCSAYQNFFRYATPRLVELAKALY